MPSPGRGLQHDDAVRGGRIAEPLERRSEATVRVSVHDQFSVTDTCTLSELVFEVIERSICEIVPSQALILAFPVGWLGRTDLSVLQARPGPIGSADINARGGA